MATNQQTLTAALKKLWLRLWYVFALKRIALSSISLNFLERNTVPNAVDHWINGGFPAYKIALGMATYGRSFRLLDAENNGLGAPQYGIPPSGKYTREPGFLAYYEICKAGFKIVEDENVHAPYGYKENEWIGFDDTTSLRFKVHRLIQCKYILIFLTK